MRKRQHWGVILLAVGTLAGCDLFGVKSNYTMEHAKVEQVLETENNGHRFVPTSQPGILPTSSCLTLLPSPITARATRSSS